MSGRRFLFYLSVSGVCMTVNNVLLIALDWAGLSLPAAIGVSFVVVCLVGYALHCRVSFRSLMTMGGLFRYVAAMSLNIPLAVVTIWFWRDLISLPMLLAAPLSTLCATGVNFALCHWAVFGRRPAVSH